MQYEQNFKGVVRISREGSGFTIKNEKSFTPNATFYFLQGLQKRGAFQTVSQGPMASAHYLEASRIEAFKAFCARNGFDIVQ